MSALFAGVGGELHVDEARVVAIEGDSAFGFSGMDFSTACRFKLPVTVVIFNNGGIYNGIGQNLGKDGDTVSMASRVSSRVLAPSLTRITSGFCAITFLTALRALQCVIGTVCATKRCMNFSFFSLLCDCMYGMEQSDVVVLVGARLNWLLSRGHGKWNPAGKFIQLDIDHDCTQTRGGYVKVYTAGTSRYGCPVNSYNAGHYVLRTVYTVSGLDKRFGYVELVETFVSTLHKVDGRPFA